LADCLAVAVQVAAATAKVERVVVARALGGTEMVNLVVAAWAAEQEVVAAAGVAVQGAVTAVVNLVVAAWAAEQEVVAAAGVAVQGAVTAVNTEVAPMAVVTTVVEAQEVAETAEV